MTMQVYINRRVVRGPWGGGNLFVKAYHELAPGPNVEVVLNEGAGVNPDVILLAGLENDGRDISAEQAIMYKMYGADCQIVLRVNENDARKGTSHVDDMLLKISEHIDGTVFVSHWLQDYFNAKGWACKNQTVIYNGVDGDVFKPQPKLNNGKVNIVAHHWSDNRMKGADIYEEIDRFVGENPDRFAFTYIGRHKCDFKHTNVVRPLSGKALGEELGKHDVYVSASRFDPGPNHILEALACGLKTFVHEDGGGCVEFAGQSHAYPSWDRLKELLEGLTTGRTNPACQLAGPDLITPCDAVNPKSWQTCVQEYNSFLEATWQRSRSGSPNS